MLIKILNKEYLWKYKSSVFRVNLLKHTASETLERITGEQDSGLEPEDPHKWLLNEPLLLPKVRKQ